MPAPIPSTQGQDYMRYRLLEDGAGAPQGAPAGEFGTVATADAWVRTWLDAYATNARYRLIREDGGFAATYMRTIAGRWYLLVDDGFTLAD